MRTVFTLAITLISLAGFAQGNSKERGISTINRQVIEAQLEFLASDWMEGREAGTRGNYLAGDYLASLFKLYQLEPVGDTETFEPNRYQKLQGFKPQKKQGYFQKFAAIEVKPSDKQHMALVRNNTESLFQHKTDFAVGYVGQSAKFKAPLVFVGYGLQLEEANYKELAEIDLEGKIVVRLAGMPGGMDQNSRAAKIFKEKKIKVDAREKNAWAFEKGALAILEYDPGKNVQQEWNGNADFRFNGAMLESDEQPESFYTKKLRLPSDPNNPPVVSISKQLFEALISGEVDYEKALHSMAELDPVSTDLNGELRLNVNAETSTVGLRNILGVVKGKDTTKIMVVGAHYDHLGKYNGQIFNGADDNGSGVVAVTTIAKAFMESGEQPECTVVFALWDGEERGLLGSRHFIEAFDDLDKTLVYLNFDMVGRNGSANAPGNKVAMIYTKAYQNLVETSKQHINQFGLNLDVNFSGVERPVGGSDNSGFARKDIPIFWFHTGGHTDYHQASDHVELINWEKLEDIIKLSYLNMWEFANNPGLLEQ